MYCIWEVASLQRKQSLKSLQGKVLSALHNSVTAGHLGVRKTLHRVKQRYYYCGSSCDIKEWCRNCRACSSRRKPQRKFQAPMQLYNVGAPLERIAIDALGPLPEMEQGNQYILVVMDYFTKWVEAHAMLNNLLQLWRECWSQKSFVGLESLYKCTRIKDTTSNLHCLKRSADSWISKRLEQHL